MSEHSHCKDYLARFSAYIDGELPPELCALLEAHLQECENCRVVLNTLQKTIDLYHVYGSEDTLPEQIRSRLFARLKLDDPGGDAKDD